ncbi:hypothetical protein CPT32_08000 [Rhizobium sophoriradicis]|nr:hypothetical protein CPT32_08000 [Rhizobium sophoriradicis]
MVGAIDLRPIACSIPNTPERWVLDFEHGLKWIGVALSQNKLIRRMVVATSRSSFGQHPLKECTMSHKMPLEDMSRERREAVIRALASKLQSSAEIAKVQQDPNWPQLEELAATLFRDSSDLARAEPETARTSVMEGIRLLGQFQMSQIAIKPRIAH